MDLQKRKAELTEEHKKAVELIEQYSQKRLQIEGAILLINEMEKAEEVDEEKSVVEESV